MPSRTTVALIVFGVVSTALGIFSLSHPVLLLRSRSSGFLVVPVVLIGIGLRRLWFDLTLDVEAHHERHEHEREHLS